MKSAIGVASLALTASSLALFAALGGQAVVRDAVNSVTVSSTAEGNSSPVIVNEVMRGSKIIQTGAESRAHLELENSVLRIGAKSSISLTDAGTTLQRGSVLYGSAVDGQSLRVTLQKLDVTITGDTGFAHLITPEKEGQPLLRIGAISGRSTVQIGREKYTLNPADLLTVSADGHSEITQFDLAKQVKSSVLLNGFKQPLPNFTKIQGELKSFAALQSRGFVRPVAADQESASLVKGSPLSQFDSGIQSLAGRNFQAQSGSGVGVNAGGTLTREQIELLIEAQRIRQPNLPMPPTTLNPRPVLGGPTP